MHSTSSRQSQNLEFDADYSLEDDDIKNLLILINQNGHEIGLHPSYNTFDNPEQTNGKNRSCFAAMRVRRLNIDQGIWGGRQHYLRFETPQTWAQLGISGHELRLHFRVRRTSRLQVRNLL